VAVSALVDAIRRPAPWGAGVVGQGAVVPVAVPALVRPAVALLLLAVAADVGIGPALGAAAAAALAGAALVPRLAAWADGRLAGTLRWAFAAVAVLGGIDLAVRGVLNV
jgi:hypothetical protein